MTVFHFAEFGKPKFVHHTIDPYSGFQWASALSSAQAGSVVIHLLEAMAAAGMPVQTMTESATHLFPVR